MPMTTVTPPVLDDSTTLIPKKMVRPRPLFDPQLMGRSLKASFVKLNPVTLIKNPVISDLLISPRRSCRSMKIK
jgi:hypothetical protein